MLPVWQNITRLYSCVDNSVDHFFCQINCSSDPVNPYMLEVTVYAPVATWVIIAYRICEFCKLYFFALAICYTNKYF